MHHENWIPVDELQLKIGKKEIMHLLTRVDESGKLLVLLERRAQRQRLILHEDFLDSLTQKLWRCYESQAAESHDYVKSKGVAHLKIQVSSNASSERKLTLVSLDQHALFIELPFGVIPAMIETLYHPTLHRAGGCVQRVVRYQRMLQLAFPAVSESLNGEMAFRNNFLCLDVTNPSFQDGAETLGSVLLEEQDARLQTDAALKGKVTHLKEFKSRLGARRKSMGHVDYRDLLTTESQDANSQEVIRKVREKTTVLDLGLSASLLKGESHANEGDNSGSIRIRIDEDDAQILRDYVSEQGDCWDFFVGFEIVDCLYRTKAKKICSFRFPLYFTPVRLIDYGLEVELKFQESPGFYLNILGLVQLVERFSSSASHSVETFLQRVLQCRFNFRESVTRPTLHRRFPISSDFLTEQRRAIFGQALNGPPSGLFEGLKIERVVFDLQRTLFFSQRPYRCLKDDLHLRELEKVLDSSVQDPLGHYSSLIGRIFTPDFPVPVCETSSEPGDYHCAPYDVSSSVSRLFTDLSHRDIVLVEGPPGTGKTYSMLNLLVHAVCNGQKVLVVSDRQSAIDALYAKISDFVNSDPHDEVDASFQQFALGVGVKRVQLSPLAETDIRRLAQELREQLNIDLFQAQHIRRRHRSDDSVKSRLHAIDEDISRELVAIDRILSSSFSDQNVWERECSRRRHDTTKADIESLTDFISYLLNSPDVPQSELFSRFRSYVRNRQTILGRLYPQLMNCFQPPDYRLVNKYLLDLSKVDEVISKILETRPRNLDKFDEMIQDLHGTPWESFFLNTFRHRVQIGESKRWAGLAKVRDRLVYPLMEDLQNIQSVIADERLLFSLDGLGRKRILEQIRKIHNFLERPEEGTQCLAWNILSALLGTLTGAADRQQKWGSVEEHLLEIQKLKALRRSVVHNKFVQELAGSRERLESLAKEKDGHVRDSVADLDSLFERVIQSDSEQLSQESLAQIQEMILQVFGVWLLKKEHIPLVLAQKPRHFDLVIIDEATQCRVDDAIPLLHRARKVIAVGDDKQTVLQRISPLDDFLFRDLELDEILQSLGASGVKAGGSHIFGMIKGLKQARVLLDEHYRCPPDVIAFSNEYVYNNQLNIMQWVPCRQSPAVVVDHTERRTRIRNRPSSGKYKGIELGMIERFFGFIERSILAYEKETGRRVDLERDVAICYFLLKNRDCVREYKSRFLRRMNRGRDVLDGAGAELQGKERDLIFYLWDVTRANFQAFLQGDDPSKRKGELNVLMSRPKKRAFHYLHKDFAELNHDRSSIARFLWDRCGKNQRQRQSALEADWLPRMTPPAADLMPWKRGDGQLLYESLKCVFHIQGLGNDFQRYAPQFGTIVGRRDRRVDLILVPKSNGRNTASIGFIELSGFERHAYAEEVAGYAAVLERVQPAITPVFLHLSELFVAGSPVLARIRGLIQKG